MRTTQSFLSLSFQMIFKLRYEMIIICLRLSKFLFRSVLKCTRTKLPPTPFQLRVSAVFVIHPQAVYCFYTFVAMSRFWLHCALRQLNYSLTCVCFVQYATLKINSGKEKRCYTDNAKQLNSCKYYSMMTLVISGIFRSLDLRTIRQFSLFGKIPCLLHLHATR